MPTHSLVAFVHFVAAFGIVATLFFEWFTFSRNPTAQDARRLALADRWYGIFAGVVLIAGFSRAIYFEKGWDFYRATPFFHLKLTAFLVIGALSVYPTIRFFKWRPDIKAGRAPVLTDAQFKSISRCLNLQLLLLPVMLLSASLMAKGVRFT